MSIASVSLQATTAGSGLTVVKGFAVVDRLKISTPGATFKLESATIASVGPYGIVFFDLDGTPINNRTIIAGPEASLLYNLTTFAPEDPNMYSSANTIGVLNEGSSPMPLLLTQLVITPN